MTYLILYAQGKEIYRKRIKYPKQENRMSWKGIVDFKKAHIDVEVARIKVKFYKNTKNEYQIIMKVGSKMNYRKK
jgi:hypothetical protein